MSTTLHLECDTCKESIWIGQRNYIYTDSKEDMKLLSLFLVRHETDGTKTHALFFRPSLISKQMDGQDGWARLE